MLQSAFVEYKFDFQKKMMNKKTVLAGIVGAVVVGMGVSAPAQAVSLVNYGFENTSDVSYTSATRWAYNPNDIDGWETTDSIIEVWTSGFNGVDAAEGNYFAELNAHIDGTLFQDVSGVDAGQQMGFSFLHRARQGTDVMNLAITDLGLDNVFGTADDTVLFTKDYSATTAQWETNTSEGEDSIMTLGNDIRFAYSAVSTGSGNNSIGNFIDEAKFGLAADVTPDAVAKDVPEPASILALLAVGGFSVGGALRKKQAT